MTHFYTGIGSRETPPDVCVTMVELAAALSDLGYWLRSGHARGADQAFEEGAGGKAVIYRPWASFEKDKPVLGIDHIFPPAQNPQLTSEVARIAARFHPAWIKLTPASQRLHMRNVPQVLGNLLNDPSQFLVCWTPRGSGSGGTRQAIRIARAYHVPVFDLGDIGGLGLLRLFLASRYEFLPDSIVEAQPSLL